MQVSVEELSSVQKKINIEIPADRVNEEIEKAYSVIQKKAKIQGFRPGKAPMNLIKRTYSDAMRDDVMRRLYEQTLYKALSDNKIEPVDSPTIESDILEHGSAFKYSALVEVMPQIQLKDYTGLEVTKEKYTADEGSINGELARMQENMAQLVPADENCLIDNGHSVSVDYSFSVEGFPEESSVAEDAIVEVGANRLIPGFEEQLVGMKIGETKEFNLVLPDGYRNSEAAGKQGHFKVTIKEVKLKELPELNDEFAQQFGDYDTIADLRAKMVEYHEKHETERIENELKDRAIKALIEKNPLEVPESMVKRQLDYMLENLKNRLKGQQMSLDMMGLDDSGFKIRFREEAADKVRGGLLLMALVEKENITVSDDELNERYEKIAAGNPDMLNRIKEYYSSNTNAKNSIISEIKEDKALSLLIDSAIITEVDGSELTAA
ncbi:MAG: trigger factor [Geobacter sp.]|nr:trigger factor [Geobacter sp.]